MKKNSPTKENTAEKPLPSPISARAYAALPRKAQAAYRPVNAKHERLPRLCLILYGVALLCVVLYLVMLASPAFSDFFNQHISAHLRALLAALTTWIPFSLGECLIWLLPLILTVVLIHAVRHRCDTWRQAAVFIGTIASVLATLFSVFVLNFAAGYRGTTLDSKLGLERRDVSAEELYDTAAILVELINRESAEVQFYTEDFSLMPYSLAELNDKLGAAYDTFCSEHDFITHTDSRVKPVLASEVMSYMHITGVYSFFTGEANLNVNFPDYTLPFTAAHELAHQRGIAREDEANFVAYLVCIGSDDAYIRYSAYLNLYEYVANALWNADATLYYKTHARLNIEVRHEMVAYNEFFEAYRDSTASKVSGTVNDTFLQIQGTPGTKSYGMVVDLAVAYYKD